MKTLAGKSILGSGLIAVDLILSEEDIYPSNINILAGGSCGNILTILSYLGWSSYPVAQLSDNVASKFLIKDLLKWDVNTRYLDVSSKGITPVIIHRILRKEARHRFEFKIPKTNEWLPKFRAITKKYLETLIPDLPKFTAFYFDRISPAILDLAQKCYDDGSIVIFEPSSIKDEKLFYRALKLCHILKFSSDRITNYEVLYPSSQAPIEIKTLGSGGVSYRIKNNGNDWLTEKAFVVSGVKDSAGAGDWCTSGIIHTLMKYSNSINSITIHNVKEAILYGQALGAINCNFVGARGAMYSLDRIMIEDLALQVVRSYSNTLYDISETINQRNNGSSDFHNTSLVDYGKLLESC